MYKLKSVNGRVNTLLRTGKDFVRNNLSTSAAQHIINCGELVESDKPEYPICVDNKWKSRRIPRKLRSPGAKEGERHEPSVLFRVCESLSAVLCETPESEVQVRCGQTQLGCL